jgi:hypothetical protein
MAARQAVRASASAALLAEREGIDRESYGLAIGKHLHDAYCAAEKALERLVELVDGDVPQGRTFHRDLLRRAARAVDGVRPAIISPESEKSLAELLGFRHVFRHVYEGFDYRKAAPNVELAARAIPRLREEITAFAASLGLAPRA